MPKKDTFFPQTLPVIEIMTPAEFKAYLESPKLCTGCGLMLMVKDFEITKQRNRRRPRSRCVQCMRLYYKTTTTNRRKKRNKAYGWRVRYFVVVSECGRKFDVTRTLNDSRPRVVSSWAHEQDAEKEALRLTAMWNS